jgi:signal transduction histidine kinase
VNIHSQNSTPEYFNLRVLVEETMMSMSEKFSNKKIELVKDIPDDLRVYCDRIMLSFVIKNILSNSLKYSYRKGQVKVSCKKDVSRVKLIIEDHGMGISKSDLSKLFNIDEIFSTEGTEKEKGAGLGLIISKDFIELNNGNIRVISEKEKETSVIITLPLSD